MVRWFACSWPGPFVIENFQAGFRLLRDRVFFFGAGVEFDRRGGWLSMAAR
jgi:hypothetical protein